MAGLFSNSFHFRACGTWWLTARSGRAQVPGQKANDQRMAGPGPDWPALPELGRAQPRMSGRDALKIAQPFMAGSASNPTNQVPAGTKESPVLAKDSAVLGRDFGRFRNVNPAINGWAIFKLISFSRVRDLVAHRKVW